MTISFFTAALSAWRAMYAPLPDTPALAAASRCVVKLSIKAVAGARTAESLGSEREGTGVVIDERGYILTIGYLVLEAASILVVTHDARIFPAQVVGFDHATGFGLLRTQGAYDGNAMPLGDSDAVGPLYPASILAHPAAGGETHAAVVARRRFTGWWEYMIEDAIFTAPPRYEHSGAALVDTEGHLVGIASLWVSDTLDTGVAFPGNMFVPVNLLKPILPQLIQHGRSGRSRPWLGVYSEQHKGHVVVSRVLPDSPAERAGLQRGDVILGIAGESVGGQSDLYSKLWASGDAGCKIVLHVMHKKSVREVAVTSGDRLDYLRPWRLGS